MRRVQPVVLMWFGVILAAGSVPAGAARLPAVSATARIEARRLDAMPPVTPHGRPRIDHSGRKENGRASYYNRYFTDRLMADGNRLDPRSNVAASRTVPLGTTARVINLENGRSVTVKMEDRGP